MRFLILFLVLGLPGCALWGPVADDPQLSSDQALQPVQSPNDDRSYKYLTLKNDLRVLLMSDPQADKGAASLDVHVGSFQNPGEREGLAHFLEHMLFLGTEKYPDAGEYQTFISEHGGSNNAFTTLEHTNYFFDIDARQLAEGLDRFAQFFVAPLLNAEYVERERQAIESEYRLKIKDDGNRFQDVLRELVDPRHPLSKFSVGNLATLADRENDPVREDLLEFYRKYYSANLMTLVVLGRESLPQLQAIVEQRFGEIPNHSTVIEHPEVTPFGNFPPRLAYIVPVQEKRALNLMFQVPSTEPYWHTKPGDFLGQLVGDESEDSLLTALKRQGLAEGLSAGMGFDTRAGAVFNISIELTPKGVAQYRQVLDQLFTWLKKIRSDGIEAWRYSEQSRLNRIDFRFLEKTDSVGYVLSRAFAMQQYPAEEVLRGDYLLDHYDPSLIGRYADLLNPGNAQVMLMAPEVTPDRRSIYYDVPYRVEEISQQDIERWSDPETTAGLALPRENPYIPEQLALRATPETADSHPREMSLDLPGEFWYYLDGRFNTPKGYFSAKLETPEVGSGEGAALAELYLAMVKDQLNAEVYPAQIAGLSFALDRSTQGIALTMTGYDDKQPVLLSRLLSVMREPQWDPKRFERIKARLLRDWRNLSKEWPIRQVFAEVAPFLTEERHPLKLAKALEPVSMEQLQKLVARLYRRGRAVIYAGGNFDLSQAEEMARQVVSGLKVADQGEMDVKSRVLALSARLDPMEYHTEIDHDDSAALLYIQGSEDSLKERAHMALLGEMIKAPFYNQLRTEKQLGYVVGYAPYNLKRVPGMTLYVQSPVATQRRLQREIDEFLQQFEPMVAGMTAEDLLRYQRSVLATIEEEPKNLNELSGHFLQNLNLDFREFDLRARMAEEIKAATSQNLLEDYRKLLLGERRAMWFVTVQQNALKPEAKADTLSTTGGLPVLTGNRYYIYE